MRAISTIVIAFWMCIQVTYGATVHIVVQTDKPTYFSGQTVNWTITAWADPNDNAGVALLAVNLDDSMGEPLSAPLNSGAEFTETEYGVSEGFVLAGSGTPTASAPRLRDMTVFQFTTSRTLDVGNDGIPHLYCKGSYTANSIGIHSLTPSLNGANYWPDGVANALPFEATDLASAQFEVLSLPTFCGDTNTVYLPADLAMPQDCYVNLADFAVVNQHWLENTCVGPSWCFGTDIDESGDVGLPDLELWAGQWLWCTDPANSSCDIYWK